MNIILIQISILTVLSILMVALYLRPKTRLNFKKVIMTKSFDVESFLTIVSVIIIFLICLFTLKTQIIENNIVKMFIVSMILFIVALGKK